MPTDFIHPGGLVESRTEQPVKTHTAFHHWIYRNHFTFKKF